MKLQQAIKQAKGDTSKQTLVIYSGAKPLINSKRVGDMVIDMADLKDTDFKNHQKIFTYEINPQTNF